jgi:hypothetical protein
MKQVLILFLALTLVGCAGTRKVIETSRTDTHVVTEHTNTEQEQTLTVTTTEIDTTVTLPEVNVSVTRPLDELLQGDTINAELNGTSVQVFIDQATNTITAKATTSARDVNVKAKVTTKAKSNRDRRTDSKSDTTIKEKEKTTTKEKEPWFDPFWVLVLLLFFGAIFLLYRHCRH